LSYRRIGEHVGRVSEVGGREVGVVVVHQQRTPVRDD
jgi:hypothetical protein